MKRSIDRSETNNAIIVVLENVRAHPNADRLQLATVLGTQVVVGMDSKSGDQVVYFESNLRVGHAYLHYNNLYSSADQNLADQSWSSDIIMKRRARAALGRARSSNPRTRSATPSNRAATP